MTESINAKGASKYAVLLRLDGRARRSQSFSELATVMVKETSQLLPYSKAAVWLPHAGVVAISCVTTLDQTTPYAQWLNRVFVKIVPPAETALIAGAEVLAGEDRDQWAEWLPAHAIWVGLTAPDGRRHGTLMFARDEPWSAADEILLNHAAASYGAAGVWRDKPGG